MSSNLKALLLKVKSTWFASSKGVCMDLSSLLDAGIKHYIHRRLEMGFKQTPSDPCIYTSLSDGLCVLAVYIDDILIAGKCSKKIAQVKAALARRFRVKDLG